MNVSFQKIDDLNGTLSVSLEKADYEPKVDEQIKNYRKKAQIPGFRPGTAPVGMIKKLYGKTFIADEVNKLATEKMYGYLKDNEIDILGQPLLSKDIPSDVDFDKSENFTFNFDLGFAPSFNFNISAADSMTKYVIEVDDKEVETEINNLQRRHGILEKVEESTSESDSILVVLTELGDDNQPLEGGVADKETTVIPELIEDEATKKRFMNTKTGDKLVVNLNLLFKGNETVMASATGIPKEGLHDLSENFQAEIKNIQKFSPAPIDQNLFDKIFGEGVVTDEETFKSKVRENVEIYYNSES
ncbi:MAG: trigger factor, partial [Bacteroidia bacterium]